MIWCMSFRVNGCVVSCLVKHNLQIHSSVCSLSSTKLHRFFFVSHKSLPYLIDHSGSVNSCRKEYYYVLRSTIWFPTTRYISIETHIKFPIPTNKQARLTTPIGEKETSTTKKTRLHIAGYEKFS